MLISACSKKIITGGQIVTNSSYNITDVQMTKSTKSTGRTLLNCALLGASTSPVSTSRLDTPFLRSVTFHIDSIKERARAWLSLPLPRASVAVRDEG